MRLKHPQHPHFPDLSPEDRPLLTGKLPFEGNSTLLLHQIQSQDPRAPRSIDATIPRDLETICLKCLAKAPDGRYATAQELADDLLRFLAGEPITARPVRLAERCLSWTRRNPMMAASLVVSVLSTFVAVSLGISATFLSGPKHSSTAELVPQSIAVSLATEPPGAMVVFYPLDELTGEPVVSKAVRPSAKIPVHLDLMPGDYLVVTALEDGRFPEVYRHVPRHPSALPDDYPHRYWERVSETAVSLFPVTIPAARSDQGMTVLADQLSTDPDHAGRGLTPFLLDQQEVTVRDFLREFHDQLPFSMRGRKQSLLSPDFPITGLFFDEAMTYAEVVGKRLPTSKEHEFAATNGWTTRYPWGDTEPPAEAWTLTSAGPNKFGSSDSRFWSHFLFRPIANSENPLRKSTA